MHSPDDPLEPIIPSMTSPAPREIPKRLCLPSHLTTSSPVPSIIVASIEPVPSVGSIRMFWMTPATRTRSRGLTSSILVVPSIVDAQWRRLSARRTSGGWANLLKNPGGGVTLGKYGSIAAALNDASEGAKLCT